MSRQKGSAAEQRAEGFLEQQGYTIVQRNYTCRMGEIDLVCLHGETLCFVEVRMRASTTYGAASETIDYRKRAKIIRTARHYVASDPERACRFDVVTIHGNDLPELIQDAFQIEG